MVKKHVVVIVGSPHRGGATLTAARKFIDDLESLGDVSGEVLQLRDYDVGTCRGCKLCFDLGEDRCPLKDDRDAIIEKMMQADGVVFASPNYSWHVPGLMKVFFDRIAFALHRPQFHGKTATAIVVQGIAFGGKIRKYLDFLAGGLGFEVVRGSVSKTLEPMTDKAIRQMDENLAKQSRRFHKQLMMRGFPKPSLFKLMMFRMGRTGIKLNAPRDQRDWNYYRERGWFESDYYYPVQLGAGKRAAGAFFDWLVAKTGMFSVAKD